MRAFFPILSDSSVIIIRRSMVSLLTASLNNLRRKNSLFIVKHLKTCRLVKLLQTVLLNNFGLILVRFSCLYGPTACAVFDACFSVAKAVVVFTNRPCRPVPVSVVWAVTCHPGVQFWPGSPSSVISRALHSPLCQRGCVSFHSRITTVVIGSVLTSSEM